MYSLAKTVCAVMILIVSFSILIATAVPGVTASQDGRGNSDAAALCRGDGYKSLTKLDGTPFASVGECINYAARNGGVAAIATVVPTPIPTGIPTPTPTLPTATTLTLTNDPVGTCSALVMVSGLEPGTGYIIAMHVSYEGGEAEVREVEVPTTHLGFSSYRVQWANIYGDKEISAYLYEIQGNELNQLNSAGPLFLDDECADPNGA